jgi:hypothetical protein
MSPDQHLESCLIAIYGKALEQVRIAYALVATLSDQAAHPPEN